MNPMIGIFEEFPEPRMHQLIQTALGRDHDIVFVTEEVNSKKT